MKTFSPNSTRYQVSFNHNNEQYSFYSMLRFFADHDIDYRHFPYTYRILCENLLRSAHEKVDREALHALHKLVEAGGAHLPLSLPFYPARVLMQDYTGVPAIVDLAAMRDAAADDKAMRRINPVIPVDLVIDHSHNVDYHGDETALQKNTELEFERNHERYAFLKWGQSQFKNLRIIPPGKGIIHQINLEYLAQVIWRDNQGSSVTALYPDTVIGTDSHTTMINGLAVLGWGVGGIEAESAMLGEPMVMLLPSVVGAKLVGERPAEVTATDIVLTVVEALRKKGVVDKFVEFFGPGLASLTVADRATLANMAPEYGATCGYFPIDRQTLAYLEITGRSKEHIALVERFSKEQGLWYEAEAPVPRYHETLTIDLSTIVPSLAGPRRPQDRLALADVSGSFKKEFAGSLPPSHGQLHDATRPLATGDIVLAALTSCTNTSNPALMIGAGLVARKAHARGLKIKPWVKCSLAPGSQVVTAYLKNSGLEQDLAAVGFYTVGYGCSSCIGNSGPLLPGLAEHIRREKLTVASILSGNRNFEGRIHPDVRANYLASPALVVAYALAGNITLDLTRDPLGQDAGGANVYLKDIWPTPEEIAEIEKRYLGQKLYDECYGTGLLQHPLWNLIESQPSPRYAWRPQSTYIRRPPYFDEQPPVSSHSFLSDIKKARLLALFGDSITTDHISPAGNIDENSPAAAYLKAHHVSREAFNSYGSRRGNHEVMIRGTFANIRLRNRMVPDKEGGYTRLVAEGVFEAPISIFDAAMEYKKRQMPTLIVAGREYGTGSSRDWAAKGPRLLGVGAVIAESFERIHRSNLVGMGVLPLEFTAGTSAHSLKLTGDEQFEIEGLTGHVLGEPALLVIRRSDGQTLKTQLRVRIDTQKELEIFSYGGILPYALMRCLNPV
jgi:aconitate hydratase